jgi:hypothetical protein
MMHKSRRNSQRSYSGDGEKPPEATEHVCAAASVSEKPNNHKHDSAMIPKTCRANNGNMDTKRDQKLLSTDTANIDSLSRGETADDDLSVW